MSWTTRRAASNWSCSWSSSSDSLSISAAGALAGERGLGQRRDGVEDRAALRRVDRAADALDGPADRVHDPAEDPSQLLLVGASSSWAANSCFLLGGQRRLVVLGLPVRARRSGPVEELLLGLAGLALLGTRSRPPRSHGLDSSLAPLSAEQAAEQLPGIGMRP